MANKLYVAIGKENEIRSMLFWAYNFLKEEKNHTLCFIHVHVPTQIREEFPASVRAIKEVEDKLYKEFESFQVPSVKIYIEKESVTDGILELISQLGIQKLVMGAGANNKLVGSLTKPASRKSNYVLQHAPDLCHIFFVSEARLIYAREGVKQLDQHLKEYKSNILSHKSFDSPSARSSSESSPLSQNTQHVSSPTYVLPNFINNNQCDQLWQALADVKLARHKAHEEYMRRRKAEKEATNALHKLKAAEDELSVQSNIIKVFKMFAQATDNNAVQVLCSNVPKFSQLDIKEATKFFDPSLRIQEGNNGSVYKGFLHNTEVAIKILKPDSFQGITKFKLEVDVLSKLRHPNLLTLIGVSSDPLALIYEYLPNGSLEDRLICKDSTPLPWQTRIRIVTELCSVLNFLHSVQPFSIIHSNLSLKNVLLDTNFSCKLSGMGSCHIIANKTLTTDERISPKSDVYDFGIILLRLLTGRSELKIVEEVRQAVENDCLYKILDRAAGDWPVVRAMHLAHIALKCCTFRAKDRPDLGSEVWSVFKPVMSLTESFSSPLQHVSRDQVPSYFLCPIFQDIMQDPQVAADGYTYEAEAIKGWFEGGHDTSPMINLKLSSLSLTPNHALRSAIQEWLQKHKLE